MKKLSREYLSPAAGGVTDKQPLDPHVQAVQKRMQKEAGDPSLRLAREAMTDYLVELQQKAGEELLSEQEQEKINSFVTDYENEYLPAERANHTATDLDAIAHAWHTIQFSD